MINVIRFRISGRCNSKHVNPKPVLPADQDRANSTVFRRQLVYNYSPALAMYKESTAIGQADTNRQNNAIRILL